MGSGALEGARRATGNAPDPGAPMAGGVCVQSGGRAVGARVADARTIGLGLWQRRRDTGSNRQVIPSVAPVVFHEVGAGVESPTGGAGGGEP